MRRSWPIRLLRWLALALILVWSGFPILLVVLSSLKPPVDIFTYPPAFLFSPTWVNYRGLLERWPDFFVNMGNSAIVTAFATLLTVLSSALAGYVYSRFRSKALAASALFMICIRILPPIVVTLPLFPAVNWLGLNDTFLILILLYATFFVSLGTLVMKTFIDQIPRELDEAAFMDGASQLQTIWRIILPLAAQGMVAAGIFVFVYSWNEFLFAFIFTAVKAKTAPLVISEMMGAMDGVDWGVLFAAATLQLIPVVLLVMLAQRYLIAGLTAGSTKG